MTLRVIGAGYGRTGTASLKIALERLGFGPCHHMEEVFRHPEEVPTWVAAARGDPVDWVRFMEPWQSSCDFPSSLYWKPLMEAFPDAKVVLTVRSPESWWDSFSTTILPMIHGFPNRIVVPWLPVLSRPRRVLAVPELQAALTGGREAAIRSFVENIEEAKRTVPPERLLVYEVKQGWEPLCAFLGVPVPDEPFPRVNEAKTFQRRTRMVTAISWAVLLMPIVAAAVILALALG